MESTTTNLTLIWFLPHFIAVVVAVAVAVAIAVVAIVVVVVVVVVVIFVDDKDNNALFRGLVRISALFIRLLAMRGSMSSSSYECTRVAAVAVAVVALALALDFGGLSVHNISARSDNGAWGGFRYSDSLSLPVSSSSSSSSSSFMLHLLLHNKKKSSILSHIKKNFSKLLFFHKHKQQSQFLVVNQILFPFLQNRKKKDKENFFKKNFYNQEYKLV
ncbi:hypothetical protein RFI_22997 [Reticulomyxa filosa]|uniref:Uncharacterized protein n=1 Tax=Reticulomyxa filosa TaxID=46433 RepID=X6MK68_RETFI|nr:hypothetical protein RFI_22997 [Reticulomyxa filosa]|eukprot:ETO14373.1 hypothetical protein RFI_22997 [Reticulomyxa filosa]